MAIQYTENLIPTMTSNTAPSGVASASSIYESTYNPYKAFDYNEATWWVSSNGSTTGWLEYEFTVPKKIQKYSVLGHMQSPYYKTASPKDWTFEGSNDGVTWNVLNTQTNITDWVQHVKKEFTFTNNASYTKYRLNISSINGFTSIYISALEMMEQVTINKYLIKQGISYYSIKPEFYDDVTTHNFTPLTLTGQPSDSNYIDSGFDDIAILTQNMTVGSDTFKPIDKINNISVTEATFTTSDNLTYTVNPLNIPFKEGSVKAYEDGTEVIPTSIDLDNGKVVFNIARTGTMTFDYICLPQIKLYKPN